jgi:hypothetical protein
MTFNDGIDPHLVKYVVDIFTVRRYTFRMVSLTIVSIDHTLPLNVLVLFSFAWTRWLKVCMRTPITDEFLFVRGDWKPMVDGIMLMVVR